ncbi:N-acetylglucosaminyl-diphospho-decaprenol L-rhamnosyltransferase [bioreactor metagenome]|uniref:N-acetylglucosaminyl-diphospho-decaprenol L-rhamnosyltransferase n=1 Tax=bioreactor metagenome TaxID=1076179 RepID=A0A645CXP6_9ZZZZ
MILKKDKISIIIVTWNTSQITKKCVDTINQYIPNQEIIVVDNGSQDDTVEILKKIKNVKLVENGANLGFAKANNIGFNFATSEYIVFMNSDIELLDNSILKMIDYLKNNPTVGIIGPKFLNPDLTPQASVFPPQTFLNAFKEFWLGKQNAYSKYIPQSSNPSEVSYISGGCIAVNKKYFQRIGKWNETYFFYFEDMDLCRQVRKSGQKIYYYPECQIIHRHGASGKNIAPAKDQWKRLIPGSKKFHGTINHYLINFIIWSGQKWQKLFQK